jgi:hypothetical protein
VLLPWLHAPNSAETARLEPTNLWKKPDLRMGEVKNICAGHEAPQEIGPAEQEKYEDARRRMFPSSSSKFSGNFH